LWKYLANATFGLWYEGPEGVHWEFCKHVNTKLILLVLQDSIPFVPKKKVSQLHLDTFTNRSAHFQKNGDIYFEMEVVHRKLNYLVLLYPTLLHRATHGYHGMMCLTSAQRRCHVWPWCWMLRTRI
jgi:hypothetical protein